ncbi:MAG: hypothetical protein KKC01_03580 [Gammaproteobacteria bacterium]|nr:hypothetical protein [Gammaproteobacteria bacterium]
MTAALLSHPVSKPGRDHLIAAFFYSGGIARQQSLTRHGHPNLILARNEKQRKTARKW